MRTSLVRVFLVEDFFCLHHFKYIVPFPSGLQSFCWKISWSPYWDSLVCYLLLFPSWFQYFYFVFTFDQFHTCVSFSDHSRFIALPVFKWVFLFLCWEVLSYYLFKYFLQAFLCLFSFSHPYNAYAIGAYKVVPEFS